jgi:hypothetical protein
MSEAVKFKVDPALTKILGESYTSVEAAVKELIDNAYDADSRRVIVALPEIFEDNPIIVIEDDGDGMTLLDVKDQYLRIANSRYSRKGDVTIGKKRKVKGRKGIGKFAGLTVANTMEITTKARGEKTMLTISKNDIQGKDVDLESIGMPITSEVCDPNEKGTTIRLLGLTQNLSFPNPDKLKQLLTREYLRENDFKIVVNGEEVSINDIPGKKFEKQFTLSNGQTVTATATLTDKNNRYYGANYRVDGKLVGKPINILEGHSYIPEKLQKRMYIEIGADCLKEDTTSDWGAINESSKIKQEIEEILMPFVEESLKEGSKMEMAAAKARHQKKINAHLAQQPEYKQKFARAALEKVVEKFWAEDTEKVETIISLMIDAFEKGHYWAVIETIDHADENHIESLADAFDQFGLHEITLMTQEASARSRFLDKLELLLSNEGTLEATIHQALAGNLWVFGYEYSHYINNQSLKKATEDLCNKVYTGDYGAKRPDLFLGMAFNREKLLIEFKRPSHTLSRDDENQAQKYRDELEIMFPNQSIKILLIGGKKAVKINQNNNPSNLLYYTYREIVTNARANYDWLINNLIANK